MKRREFLSLIPAILFPNLVFSETNLFSDLENKFKNLKWISYSPTNYTPGVTSMFQNSRFPKTFTKRYLENLPKAASPPDNSIRQDMDVLLSFGIKGIVTYGANNQLKNVPQIAKEQGIEGVVMGIWDLNKLTSAGIEEWNNAVAAKNYVDGYCVGNEGLYSRYTFQEVENYIANIKSSTGKPATTTEVLPHYQQQWVVDVGDWVFPTIHPFWANIRDSQEGANWTLTQFEDIKSRTNGRYLIAKETGFPTAGEETLSEDLQTNFYRTLKNIPLAFCYFEAFDQPWKNWSPVEPHWGLWTKDRFPKKIIKSLNAKANNWKIYE